jgi:hypothetical protein
MFVALVTLGACSQDAEDTAATPANEPAASAVGDTAIPEGLPPADPAAPAADPAAPVDPAAPADPTAPAPEGGGLIDDNE